MAYFIRLPFMSDEPISLENYTFLQSTGNQTCKAHIIFEIGEYTVGEDDIGDNLDVSNPFTLILEVPSFCTIQTPSAVDTDDYSITFSTSNGSLLMNCTPKFEYGTVYVYTTVNITVNTTDVHTTGNTVVLKNGWSMNLSEKNQIIVYKNSTKPINPTPKPATAINNPQINNIHLGNILLSDNLPIGTIVMFYGNSLNKIPNNWKICDGNNGTPNLCDKIVIGNKSGNINDYSYYDSGQNITQEYKLNKNQLPEHKHTITFKPTASGFVWSNTKDIKHKTVDSGNNYYGLYNKKDSGSIPNYSVCSTFNGTTSSITTTQTSMKKYKYYKLIFLMRVS